MFFFANMHSAGVRLEDLAGTDAGVYVASFVKGSHRMPLFSHDILIY